MFALSILIFINFIFQVYQSDIENSDFNIAINILKTLESENKSFCFESKMNLNPEEINTIARILFKIKHLTVMSIEVKQDARKIIVDYSRFIQLQNNFLNNIVNELVENNCNITSFKEKDINKGVIEKLIKKQSIFGVNNSGEYLGIACAASTFIREHTYLDLNQKNYLQDLVDIIVYNNEKLLYITENKNSKENVDLLNLTHKFIIKHSSINITLTKNILDCLILKSIESYRINKPKLIDDTYRNIIFNGLRLDKTCEIRNLGSRKSELIDVINSSNLELNLTNSHIIALLDGFENLYRMIEPTNILYTLKIKDNLNKYILENTCEFNKDNFALDLNGIVDQLKNNTYSSHNISDIVEIVAIFCVYANINNYPVSTDNFMMYKLLNDINLYIYLIDTLKPIEHDFVNKILEIIKSDSEYIYKYISESYVYKEKIICYLKKYKENSDQDFSSHLTVFGNYLYNEYIFEYCPNKVSNLSHFAKSLSKLLLTFGDREIFNFMTIEKIVRETLFDKSHINDDLTFIRWYQYNPCFINESTYNYYDIKMGEQSIFFSSTEEMLSKIIQRCSIIQSTIKSLPFFNKPIKIPLVKLNNILFDVKLSKILLSNNSARIFKVIETKTENSINNLKLTRGEQIRVFCEVNLLLDSLPNLTDELLNEISIHILHFNINKFTCQYSSNAFSSYNVNELVRNIQLHPSFVNVNKNLIVDFIYRFNNSFIKNIYNIFESHSISESLVKLINSSTCSLIQVRDIRKTLSDNLRNKLKNMSNVWYSYFTFYECIEMIHLTLSLYSVERGGRLSSSEVEIIKLMYQQVINNIGKSTSKAELNIDNIIRKMRNNKNFVHFNNSLKFLLLSCHTHKLHLKMLNRSKVTTTLDSSIDTTTSLSTEKSDITSTVSELTTLSSNTIATTHNDNINNFTTQMTDTTTQMSTELSSNIKTTEESIITSKETITTQHPHSTPDKNLSNTTTEIITEILSSTNTYNELPISKTAQDKQISESTNTTKSDNTSYSYETNFNKTKLPNIGWTVIIGIMIGISIFVILLIVIIIYGLKHKTYRKKRSLYY